MLGKPIRTLPLVCLLVAMLPTVRGSTVELQSVQFPEKPPVQVSFTATPATPAARLAAEVTYRQGQARIELTYQDMKPAILFDVNEASLKPEARLGLAKLARILPFMPNQEALIEGHTDSTGSPDYNLDLSQRRANAVLLFLQSQGLDATRLRAVGFGMQRPVADNTSPDGRKRNRRVEIVISQTCDPTLEVTRATPATN